MAKKKKQKKWTEADVEAEVRQICRELKLTFPAKAIIQIRFMSPKKLKEFVGGRDARAAVSTCQRTLMLILLTEAKKWPREELRSTLAHEIGHAVQAGYFQNRGRQKLAERYVRAHEFFRESSADILGGVPLDFYTYLFLTEDLVDAVKDLIVFQDHQLSRETTLHRDIRASKKEKYAFFQSKLDSMREEKKQHVEEGKKHGERTRGAD